MSEIQLMRTFFLVLSISMFLTTGFNQKKLNSNSNYFFLSDLSLQRMDAYWNLGLKKRIKYVELGSLFGLGIEKTFFQQSFSPHLELFSYYNLFQKERDRKIGVVFGPGILVSGTSFKIGTPIYYGDFFAAYQLCIGGEIKLTHQAGYGVMLESFSVNNTRTTNKSYNFFAKIGVSYAFHI